MKPVVHHRIRLWRMLSRRSKRLPLTAAGAMVAASLVLAPVATRTRAFADDKKKDEKKDDDKKKDKEKEEKESRLESGDARTGLQKVQKKIDAGSFQDALAAARELVDKHGDELVRIEDKEEEARKPDADVSVSLHLTARMALRRALATLPPEGRDVLSKQSQEEAQHRLEAGRAAGDTTPLLDCADRFFPLDEAGESLLLAGDLLLEKGSILSAFVSWRDVLERHPNPAIRVRAAKRLLATLPVIKDPATARDLARAIDAAELEGGEDLAKLAKAYSRENDEAELAECSVDGSGNVGPITTGVVPGESAFSIPFPDVPKNFDFRDTSKPPTNEWGQVMPQVRRILVGHLATDDYLIIHHGKTIYAYDREGEGEVWHLASGRSGLGEYMTKLLTTLALPRYGMVQDGKVLYATIRSPKEESGIPRGLLVAAKLRTGRILWDTDSLDPEEEPVKKKKDKDDKGDDEKKEAKLSFVGAPLLAGDRLYCGATSASAPNETFVIALDARTGRVVWKRALASSEPYT
ncbi:PQQ-binding-like beta-propeller repeat protein, partial [bacterium]|nr:PQQ-binding-like beta-propeller repeat protein [bacterium]